MNIQFCHNRKLNESNRMDGTCLSLNPRGGTTVALEVMPPWFFDTLRPNDFFEKKVGIARCSEDDNYCKKTGREISTSRLKVKRLVVTRVEGNDDHKIMVLIDADGNTYVLEKQAKYNKVHFIEFYGKE